MNYKEILENIIKNGKPKQPVRFENGNPIPVGNATIGTFCEIFRHDMSDGFPLTTLRKMPFKSIRVELEGFIKGVTDKKWYQERGCKFWSEWSNPVAVKDSLIEKYATQDSIHEYDEREWLKQAQKETTDLGPIYGANWRNFDGWYKPTPQIPRPSFSSNFDLLEENSKFGLLGNIYSSNNYGNFKVVREYYKGNQQRFDIQFIKTKNTQLNRTKQNIITGKVFDSWYPSVYGVACMGNLECKNDPMYNKLRVMWESMISRCYNQNDKCYNIYGGKGVYVDNRWLVLSNFIEDIRTLEHWEQKANDWDRWSLDKDYFQKGYYSKYTCLFLNKAQQVQYSNRFDSENINQHLYKKGTDQLKSIVDKLKTNPYDRRMVCSAWNPNQMNMMALPPCHYAFTVVVYGDKLNLCWKQRSVDSSHGLPSNIASYALLTLLLCEESGLKPGELVGVLEDCHLYENTLPSIQELLKREERELPQVKIKRKSDGSFSIFDWTWEDVELLNYNPHPKLDMGKVTV